MQKRTSRTKLNVAAIKTELAAIRRYFWTMIRPNMLIGRGISGIATFYGNFTKYVSNQPPLRGARAPRKTPQAKNLFHVNPNAPARPQSSRSKPTLPLPLAKQNRHPNAKRIGVAESIFIFSYFGLLSICGFLILILFLQLREMKTETARLNEALAETKTRIVEIERNALRNVATTDKKASTAPPPVFLDLSYDDIKLIRQAIKVPPPQAQAQQTLRPGDETLDKASAPVPSSLVDQVPSLRGTRFAIDQNGSIIIIGTGSNRVEAIINYQ